MARRLTTFVHVGGNVYGPDDDVPADVAARIGDHAWESDDDQDGDEPAAVGFDDPGTRENTTGPTVEAPPRSGRGSSVDAWRTFAEQRDLDVPADATREDIIAAAEDAGMIEREA
jgi:hypothetical protein